MSDIIHLLPDSVANQIAAGEVIQRPASVVKELVENAVDAGAKEIHVLVTDAGKTCIQVIDDGRGMSETDARLAFERHATSKIQAAADLFALRTMGFRGEALASIAAVAEVELKTRQTDDELGTRLLLAGSRVESQEVVSCPKGSNFSVKNLFFNVPARRKFLKANSTELSNILAEFERIVLVHPDVSFYLYSNDTELFNLPASPLRQRIMAVFGKKMNQQLLSLEVETSMVKISGYIAKPETSRKKGLRQYFFVNGRYMRHPYFHKAVMEAYDRLIPVGEQVSYFIYFDVDPANIDVNIHPTKTEIKFENEQAIWQILSAAVKETLGKSSAVPSIDFDTEDMPDIPAFNADAPLHAPQLHYNADYNPFKSSSASYGGEGYSRRPIEWEALYSGVSKASKMNTPAPDEVDAGEVSHPATGSQALIGHGMPGTRQEQGAQHFQFKGRFILTSVKSGLLVIDQHRAQQMPDQILQMVAAGVESAQRVVQHAGRHRQRRVKIHEGPAEQRPEIGPGPRQKVVVHNIGGVVQLAQKVVSEHRIVQQNGQKQNRRQPPRGVLFRAKRARQHRRTPPRRNRFDGRATAVRGAGGAPDAAHSRATAPDSGTCP